MSRNSEYEKRRKAKGQTKITVWVPDGAVIETKQMCDFLCSHRGFIPFMAKSVITGKFQKAV